MITLWGRLNSHNVKKVAWFCEMTGIPHVRHDVGGRFGMNAAYLRLNPNALIPTIEDGDLVLWESNAILRYLAARYAPDYWPEDPAARASADKWMDWQFTYADAQRLAFVNLVRRPAEDRRLDEIAASAIAAGKQMAILDAVLSRRPWLSGDRLGLGDIPMGVYTHSFFTLDIDRPDLPNVRAWYDRLQEQPGYRSQVMIPLT